MVRFMRAIISRPATFTLIILSVNIFVFLILTAAGGSENPQVLIAYGASFKASIDMGEWWRFITPVFMHIGWIHLLVNMYSLFVLGPYVEKLYGSAKFVVFWMVTGAAGVAASYFTSMYQMSDDTFLGHFLFRGGGGPSAGASGALFGLVGVMFVFGIKFRHELPDGFKRAFGTGLLPTILINLFIGYTIPFINNAAHLGGLVAGAVLALFIDYKRPEEGERIALAWRVLQVAVLVLIVASFMSVWRNLKEPTPTLAGAFEHLLTGGAPDSDAYRRAINQGQQAFAATLQGDKDAANPAIKTLDETPGLDPQSDVLRTDLKVMLARARDVFSSEPQRDDAPKTERIAEANQLVEDFKAWQERFRQWVGAEGENYDIQMPDPPKTMPAPSTAPESETRSKETGN
jgi:membrane associated rhomboid family serine protease